jgi:hypothetical protein
LIRSQTLYPIELWAHRAAATPRASYQTSAISHQPKPRNCETANYKLQADSCKTES